MALLALVSQSKDVLKELKGYEFMSNVFADGIDNSLSTVLLHYGDVSRVKHIEFEVKTSEMQVLDTMMDFLKFLKENYIKFTLRAANINPNSEVVGDITLLDTDVHFLTYFNTHKIDNKFVVTIPEFLGGKIMNVCAPYTCFTYYLSNAVELNKYFTIKLVTQYEFLDPLERNSLQDQVKCCEVKDFYQTVISSTHNISNQNKYAVYHNVRCIDNKGEHECSLSPTIFTNNYVKGFFIKGDITKINEIKVQSSGMTVLTYDKVMIALYAINVNYGLIYIPYNNSKYDDNTADSYIGSFPYHRMNDIVISVSTDVDNLEITFYHLYLHELGYTDGYTKRYYYKPQILPKLVCPKCNALQNNGIWMLDLRDKDGNTDWIMCNKCNYQCRKHEMENPNVPCVSINYTNNA